MEGAVDKTYISGRIMQQYAQERQQRIEQKSANKAQNLSMAAGKTFSEDSGAAQQDPQVPQLDSKLSLIAESPIEEEKKEDVVMEATS